MKRLITAKDIAALVKSKEKTLYIEESTIVTAAAKDAAKTEGIEITTDKPAACECETKSVSGGGEITSDIIYETLKKMLSHGTLSGLAGECQDKPYCSKTDAKGVKIVNGSSVKMENLDTGTPGTKACYQEVIGEADASHVGAGFLEIDDSSFEWTLEGYEEIDYVIDGTLNITVDGTTYTGKKGDVFFVPSGSTVVFASPDKAKIFFTTFAVN